MPIYLNNAKVEQVRTGVTPSPAGSPPLAPTADGAVGTSTDYARADHQHPSELPSGGIAGQVLTKTASGEEWADAPKSLPDGGAEGQVLTKSTGGAQWADAPNCLVKLAGPLVTAAANAAMEFDLSQVDMTQVAALFVVFSIRASGGTASVSVNGSAVSTICSNNGSTSAGIVWLVPLDGKVGAFSANAVSRSGLSTANSGTNSAVEWTALSKVTIGGASYSGATATLFAVKK